MVFTEGTITLPRDGNGDSFSGIRDNNGLIWAMRADDSLNLRVALWGANSQPLLTEVNPGQVKNIGSNTLLIDAILAVAGSASAGTTSTLDVNMPGTTHPTGLSYVAITNPSTSVALTLIFQNKETFSAGSPVTHYPEVSRVTIPANKPEGVVFVVQGWLLGDGARLALSPNATADASGINCAVRVRKI